RSSQNQRLLTLPLIVGWLGPPPRRDGRPRPFIADANLGVFPSPLERPLVPDAFLSLDVTLPADLWEKKNRSYFTNLMGKPADVWVEIVSNGEGGELGVKKRRYAKMRVPFYVVHDPQEILSGVVLRGFALRGDRYARMQEVRFDNGALGFWFDDVGLGLLRWDGIYEKRHSTWLRWCLADGTVVPAADEEHVQKEAAQKRAEDERRRAEDERRQKEAAETRAEQEHRRAEDERRRAEDERRRAEDERKDKEAERARAERLVARL